MLWFPLYARWLFALLLGTVSSAGKRKLHTTLLVVTLVESQPVDDSGAREVVLVVVHFNGGRGTLSCSCRSLPVALHSV